MTQERIDPVIDEVREVRQRISARFGHDPARLIAYYIKLQERHRDRLVDPPIAAALIDESARGIRGRSLVRNVTALDQ